MFIAKVFFLRAMQEDDRLATNEMTSIIANVAGGVWI